MEVNVCICCLCSYAESTLFARLDCCGLGPIFCFSTSESSNKENPAQSTEFSTNSTPDYVA